MRSAVIRNVTIPAEWAQGRASFGGLVAALQYEAMRARVPADRPVRSLAITFVGPVEPEVPVSFEVEVLREGKAVSQVLGRAMQNGQVVTLVQGSFGASRPSEVAIAAHPAPEMKHWDECQELPYIKGVTPEFMRHLAMRWSVGGSAVHRQSIAGDGRLGAVARRCEGRAGQRVAHSGAGGCVAARRCCRT
jgi:acyl-CoA thioesterase